MTSLATILMTCLASAEPAAPTVRDAFSLPPSPGFDLTAAADQAPAIPNLGKWTGSVSLGATVSDGNTHRKTATATATAEKRREKDRTTLNFLWNYARESPVTTQRQTYGSVKYDYFLSRKAYLYGAASGENNLTSQLNLRTIVGVGAGYQFVEDDSWKVSGEGGLSYVKEDSKDNTADKSFLAARLAYKADWKASDQWTVGQWGELYPSLKDKEDISARLDTHAKITLTKSMFVQLQWLFTWDNTPATGAKRADDLYLVTVGWSF